MSGAGVSFSIKKTGGSKVVKPEERHHNGDKKDYVLSLEGKEIHSTNAKTEKRELVIPMIGKNKWRTPQTSGTQVGECPDPQSSQEVELEREAAEAVLRDLQEAQVARAREDEGMVVPLLLANKPPLSKAKDKDEFVEDVELRPEQSSLDDYDSVPIADFGTAMLRGMGWKKGTAIGLTNKGLVEPIEFIRRPGGLGLGATPREPPPDKKPRIKKQGEVERKLQAPYVDKDGRVKHYKNIGQAIPHQPAQGFAVGNYGRVLRGPHKNLCGKILSVDADTARVVLKMAINNQTLSFSQHHLEVVSRDDYLKKPSASHRDGEFDRNEKQYGLVKRDVSSPHNNEPPLKKYKSESKSHSHSLRVEPDHHSSRRSESPHQTSKVKPERTDSKSHHKSNHESSKKRPWLYPHLRVRLIDQKYHHGKYYNNKVVILDVISLGECVCQTDHGKLLEGLMESMLETVVPRSAGSKVMIVGGPNRGKVASIVEQERSKARAVVKVIDSQEILKVDFDDICEYTGHIEDDV